MSDEKRTSPRRAIWKCKIGCDEVLELPDGCDRPMRRAVQDAYFEITGKHAVFTFSGWNEELTSIEKAIVEDKL
jgi:hypothetical protein